MIEATLIAMYTLDRVEIFTSYCLTNFTHEEDRNLDHCFIFDFEN